MKILANENCNINDYCGIIMLTYLHVDKDKAEEIGKWLTNAGYSFVKNEISPITLLSGSYCEKYNKLLENCGCYIFPITENFNEYYRPLINVILYQIGVLESINKKRILPVRYRKNELSRKEIEDLLAKQNDKKAEESLLNIANDEKKKNEAELKATPIYFESLPIQREQYISDEKGLIEAFRDKYHTHVSLKPFKPEKLNESLNDRLVYRRIHTSFDITLRDYKAAKALYKANEGKRATGAKMDQEFIKWLNNSIVCGTDVLSFGSPVTFTNNTVQYEKEADLKGYEFRIRLTANRNFFIKNNDNAKAPCDVIGNLIMEFLIPVHKLLGVNFKCFLSFVDAQSSERKANEEETNNACNREILETLLRSNFTKVHDVYGKNEKLYFCFDFNDSKEHAAPDGFGTKVDYLYPQ